MPAATRGSKQALAHAHTQAHERIFDEISNRLARVEGHVRGVKRMWEDDKGCPEVLLQISAVQAALKQIGRMILEEHVETCLAEAGRRGRREEALAELKDALKQFI